MKLLTMLILLAAVLAAPVEARPYTPWTNPIIWNEGGFTVGEVWAWFRRAIQPRPIIMNDGG